MKRIIKTLSLKVKIKLAQAFNGIRGEVRQHIVTPFSKRVNCGFFTFSLFSPLGLRAYMCVKNFLEND
jgi:hypothetical protein